MRARAGLVETIAASLIVALAGGIAIWQTTDGLTAFTTEASRRLAVAARPVQLASVRLQTSSGDVIDAFAPGGTRTLVEFVYTRCPTICTVMGQQFHGMQQSILDEGRQGQVRLLSVSFDLHRDSPEAMTEYAGRHGANPQVWSIARPRNQEDLAAMLDDFGVTVVPDSTGEFVHNAAIHYVDAQGRLAGIFDFDDARALKAALAKSR